MRAYPDGAERTRLLETFLQRVGAQPGVRAVAATSNIPFGGEEPLATARGEDFVASDLYGVTRLDPATYAGASVLALVVAGVAAAIPARHAARANPGTALRDT